ncbi:hypothetical protein QFC19_008932 [Naganishia cerealis]|uniref:Uncharacterized protein n=1 Tax=Naganishia cerealis TaxID=610337 RepID=A0ACC2UXZ5_9TREE|nr:hypothetical protein QFC19_008932 [Naganishia cerealis]
MAPQAATEDMFKGVFFYVDDSVAAETRPSVIIPVSADASVPALTSQSFYQLVQDMIHLGGKLCPPPHPLAHSFAANADSPRIIPRFDLDKITHIISETWEIPERQLIEGHQRRDEIFTVTRLPFQPYVFESPDEPPPILRPEWHADPEMYPSQHMTNMLKHHASVGEDQALGWGSVLGADKMASGHISSALKKERDVFGGKRVILGCQIEVSPDFRVAIEATVVRAGGNVLPEERLRDCDFYVTPWREGKEYLRAVKHGKIVGTLPWLNHVLKIGRVTAPKDNLLHYPVPRGGIPEFKDCTISVTNYTGEARDYLKRLMSTMDAKFTTTLAREVNTHLIAATKSGEKVSRASTWSIPVLNHLYLEECFKQWRRLPEAVDDRFTLFPFGVNYMTLLGNAQLTDKDLERWTAPAKDIDDDEDMQEIDGDITATGLTLPTQASETSRSDRTAKQEDLADIEAVHIEMNTIFDVQSRSTSVLSADPALPSASEGPVIDNVPTEEANSLDEHPPMEHEPIGYRSEEHRAIEQPLDSPPPLHEVVQQEAPNPVEPVNVQPAVSISSPLSGGPEDDHDMAQPAVDDQVHDAVEENHQRQVETKGAHPVKEDEPMQSVMQEAPTVKPKPVVEATVAVTRSQTEVNVVPTTQFKNRASTQTVRKTRSVAPTATESSKRRRLSTPGQETPVIADEPVPAVQGRVRRQAATKAADMLHNVIAPDMALHEKEKKRKDIISPKSRRAAWVNDKAEGSNRKSKLGQATTDDGESTEDEPEAQLKAKGTQRSVKNTTSATRGRSRGTIVRDTARTRLGSRSASELSALPVDEEDTTVDLDPTSVKLMTTGFNLDDRLAKILKSFGVRFTDKPLDMTHLICRSAIRTTKLLIGLAKGIDVLSVDWLEKCAELRRMIDPEPFLLKDPSNEKKLGFSLAKSIAESKRLHRDQGGLFAGKLFHITFSLS